MGMVVLGCGKQVLGVRAAKTTIERVREFGVLIFLFDFTGGSGSRLPPSGDPRAHYACFLTVSQSVSGGIPGARAIEAF